MKKITCTIRFITPAFLGDANGNGAWRVPPFKAELRQWWRIVLAARGMDWEEIRSQEAKLFGNAWQDETTRKSEVRLRLSHWNQGKLTPDEWPHIKSIKNGLRSDGKPNWIDGGVYLGFGPVAPGPKLKNKSAINSGNKAELRLGITTSAHGADAIVPALALMSRYGTVGGRSRNGWGSFILDGDDIPSAKEHMPTITLRQALESDWVQGIGLDAAKPLIWATERKNDWKATMHTIAQLRSDLNRKTSSKAERALLSYPVKPVLSEWKNFKDARLPNSLRFKVVPENSGFRALVFHMPCKPENPLRNVHPFANKPEQLLAFWQGIHNQLDDRNELQRVPA